MTNALLPIGTVVLLKDSTKRVMIIGVLQIQRTDDGEKMWDYSGVYYPEGYMGPDKTFLFNNDQIVRAFALGYQDDEFFQFEEKIAKFRSEKLNEKKN